MARSRFKPYRPYVTPQPPAGTFDPALGAARDAATRGLGDVRMDTALAGERAGQDYQFGQDEINRGYTTGVSALKRQYDILAGQQQSQAAGSGVLSGGALLQSAAKRQANQAQQVGDMTADRDVNLGRLSVGYGRGVTDRTTSLTRAQREDTAFGLDTLAQENFQAAQSGYSPPLPGEPGGPARNEFTNRNGLQRRRIVRGGVEYIVAPTGAVVHHRRLGGGRGRG